MPVRTFVQYDPPPLYREEERWTVFRRLPPFIFNSLICRDDNVVVRDLRYFCDFLCGVVSAYGKPNIFLNMSNLLAFG